MSKNHSIQKTRNFAKRLCPRARRYSNTVTITFALALFSATFATRAYALDGGAGRSISGSQITPYQALVPPEPGAIFVSLGEAYYDADIGGSVTMPLGNKLVANINSSISFTTLTLGYDWPGNYGNWNLMSAVVLPFAYERISADVSLANGTTRHVLSKATGIYDLMFRVVNASYHISKTQHVSAALDVWAPTGSYDSADIANLSLDNWTFIPTVSYTQLFKNDIEFSALWALEYYTKNRHSDYQSGLLSRVEVLGLYHHSGRFSIGLIGSWMQQLTDDTGPLADRFNGFKGRAYGIGPIVTTMVKINDHPVNLSLRWIHEFETRRMTQGEAISFSADMEF